MVYQDDLNMRVPEIKKPSTMFAEPEATGKDRKRGQNRVAAAKHRQKYG